MPIIDKGIPCRRCGCTERYISNGKLKGCVKCQLKYHESHRKTRVPSGMRWKRHKLVPIERRCQRCEILLEHERTADCGDYCGQCLAMVIFGYRPERELIPDDWWQEGGEVMW